MASQIIDPDDPVDLAAFEPVVLEGERELTGCGYALVLLAAAFVLSAVLSVVVLVVTAR